MFVPRNITKESIKVIIWRRSAKRPRTIWCRMAGTRSCNEIVFWEKRLLSGCSPPELKRLNPCMAFKPCPNGKKFGKQMQLDLVH